MKPDLQIERRPIERLIPFARNPRTHTEDLFGGSGSTLIAAEKLGSRARLVEIDPAYADIVIRRWEEFAGKKAVLDGAGRSFEEVADERGRLSA